MTRSMGVAARIGCGVAAGVVAGGVLIAQRYLDRQARIEGTQTLGLHFSVLCPEDVNVATEQEIVNATSGTFEGMPEVCKQ